MLKNAIIALGVLVSVSGLLGCNGGTTPSDTPETPTPNEPIPEGTQIELRLDQAKLFDGLTLTWTSVEDSRCPQGVTCVWAGEAVVRIRAIDAGIDGEMTLKLGSPPEEAVATTARHELRLTAVEPYPRHGTEVAREERRASIVVKRR